MMEKLDFLASPTVTLVIGTEDHQQFFVVHKTRLTTRSNYITRALEPDRWCEGEERVIPFPEDEPAIFSAYLHFVYRPENIQDYANAVNWDNFDKKYTDMCKVYILATMLLGDNMTTAVSAQLQKLSEREFIIDYEEQHRPLPNEAIRTVYKGSIAGDNVCSIFVKTFSKFGTAVYGDAVIQAGSAGLPAAFLQELALHMMVTRDIPRVLQDAKAAADKWSNRYSQLNSHLIDLNRGNHHLAQELHRLQTQNDKTGHKAAAKVGGRRPKTAERLAQMNNDHPRFDQSE